MPRVTEAEVSTAVLQILADQASGEASILRLKKLLPTYLKLSANDCAPSVTRAGEQMWEQQVRNIVSHRGTIGNFVHDGYLRYRPRHLSITPAGLNKIGR